MKPCTQTIKDNTFWLGEIIYSEVSISKAISISKLQYDLLMYYNGGFQTKTSVLVLYLNQFKKIYLKTDVTVLITIKLTI